MIIVHAKPDTTVNVRALLMAFSIILFVRFDLTVRVIAVEDFFES